MTWTLTLLPYVVSTLVSLALAAYANRRHAVPAARPLAVYFLGEAIWTLGYIFELVADSLPAKLSWDSFQFVGMFTATLAALVTVQRYVGRTVVQLRRFWLASLVIPVVVTVSSLTDPWHHLLRRTAHLIPGNPVGALWYDFTLIDYAGMSYAYGNFIYAMALLFGHWQRGTRLVRRQTAILMVGLGTPIVLSTMFVFGFNPFPQRDPAPLVFLLGGLILGWGLLRVRIFDLLPVAKEVIFECMSDGVIVVNPNARIIDLNPAAGSILQSPIGSVLGRPIEAVACAAQLELPNAINPVAISRLPMHDGSEHWYETTSRDILDAAGVKRGTLFVMHDVTESQRRESDLQAARNELEAKVADRTMALSLEIEQRKQTEQALAKSEHRFRAIFDQSFQLVGLTDPDGILLDANISALTLIGAQLRDVVGRPFWETPWWNHTPEEAARLRTALSAAAQGVFVRYETTHVAVDGTIHNIDFSLKPIKDEHGSVVMIIQEGRDITELKNSEQERLSLTAQLHQAQRLESLGRLAGGVAHDFNNLLTVITGNLSLLQSAGVASPEMSIATQDTLDAAQRASELTRQLLMFSRRQIVEPRVFDPVDCLNGLRKLLPRVVGEDISLKINITGDPGSLFMDPSQFEQVVMNLIVNARDAMPAGGQLDVTLSRIEIEDPKNHAQGPTQAGPYVLLTVSDTGTGILESIVDHLFEPFFTTKAPGMGTGLGLATVHGIVSQASGSITVASKPGWGTTFRVYLPSCEHASKPSNCAVKPTASAEIDATILVVEDQTSVRELVIRSLKRYGFRVVAHADAASALAYAQDPVNPFDLVLTDVVMPEMGGRALADALRQLRPSIPIVFMSGHTDDTILRHGIEESRESFLAKPFTPAILVEKLRSVLEQAGAG